MKFYLNDIIQNRHGTKARIIKVDPTKKEYTYQYLIPAAQFQGDFCHPAEDIEKYWSLSTRKEPIISPVVKQETTCSHIWKDYLGFRESYKYCERCDLKLS